MKLFYMSLCGYLAKGNSFVLRRGGQMDCHQSTNRSQINMVKVDKDKLAYLMDDWIKPIDFGDEDDESPDQTPSPTAPNLPASGKMFSLAIPDLGPKIKKNYGVRTKVPPKEITGVDRSIIEICASLSNQIYDASSNDYFKLEASDGTQATILILDTHGHHSPAIPSFAVAAVGSTLIMGWVRSPSSVDAFDFVGYWSTQIIRFFLNVDRVELILTMLLT